MGCQIIEGKTEGGMGVECACFYDSVTDTVFGKLMNDLEEAESFQKYVMAQEKKDLRQLSVEEFDVLLGAFRDLREELAE